MDIISPYLEKYKIFLIERIIIFNSATTKFIRLNVSTKMLKIPCREHDVSRGSLDNIVQHYICCGEMKIIFKNQLKPQSLILNLENLGNLSVYLREPFILVYLRLMVPDITFVKIHNTPSE